MTRPPQKPNWADSPNDNVWLALVVLALLAGIVAVFVSLPNQRWKIYGDYGTFSIRIFDSNSFLSFCGDTIQASDRDGMITMQESALDCQVTVNLPRRNFAGVCFVASGSKGSSHAHLYSRNQDALFVIMQPAVTHQTVIFHCPGAAQ